MSIHIIGDENTVLGFALIGVEGEVVRTLEDAQTALDEALETPDVKVLLITEDWAGQMREQVDRLKMQAMDPVVLEIPGPGPEPARKSLRDLVRQAIGIRLGA